MIDPLGADLINITDEEGVEYELEIVDRLDYEGESYMALISADANPEEEETELIILKTIVEDGEELLSTLDSDEELDKIYELFMERLFEDEEEEEA